MLARGQPEQNSSPQTHRTGPAGRSAAQPWRAPGVAGGQLAKAVARCPGGGVGQQPSTGRAGDDLGGMRCKQPDDARQAAVPASSGWARDGIICLTGGRHTSTDGEDSDWDSAYDKQIRIVGTGSSANLQFGC